MKYSEFEREVEKMGLDVDANERIVFVRRKSGSNVIAVYKSMENHVDCGWSSYIDTMTDEQRGDLFDLAYQLAKTPLAEREEEKRCYLRYDVPPLLRAVHAKPRYLYRRIYDGYTDTSFSQTNDLTFKTIFTESEIAEMDITGFQKVEVEE